MKWKNKSPLPKWEVRKNQMVQNIDLGPPNKIGNKRKREILKDLDRQLFKGWGPIGKIRQYPDWLISRVGYFYHRGDKLK